MTAPLPFGTLAMFKDGHKGGGLGWLASVEVLKTRYARSEVSSEEFHRARRPRNRPASRAPQGPPERTFMATDPLHWRRACRFALATGAILVLLGVSAAAGWASAGVEQQGAQLLQSVQAGKQKCQQLSSGQFEAIGEYVMGAMLGSTARHDAMNRQIGTMAGASGEAQAHVFMGQRFAGCATGAAPAAFGSMMGMMGSYSGSSGGGVGNGRDGANGVGPGMMGGSGSRARGEDGWSSTDTVLVILLAVLVAALVAWRPWRRSSPQTPLDVLSDRYARGDIDAADYEQRRQALESPT
jgi:uncharacterized membrane protein